MYRGEESVFEEVRGEAKCRQQLSHPQIKRNSITTLHRGAHIRDGLDKGPTSQRACTKPPYQGGPLLHRERDFVELMTSGHAPRQGSKSSDGLAILSRVCASRALSGRFRPNVVSSLPTPRSSDIRSPLCTAREPLQEYLAHKKKTSVGPHSSPRPRDL